LLFVFLVLLAPARASNVPVLTVCEALQGRDGYDGQVIVVVGRYHRGVHGNGLSQECERSIMTDGLVWPNGIWTAGLAKANADRPQLNLPDGFRWDDELLNSKLVDVQATTQLGKGFRLPNQWAAVYGRFKTNIPLRTRKVNGKLTRVGFGPQCQCPALLLSPENGVHVLGDK
jgi:hypothetical protein